MENVNEMQNQEPAVEVLADVPKSDTDIYRVSRKEYKGTRYLDLRIFFRAKEDANRLIPTSKGVVFAEKFREEIVAGLMSACRAPAVTRPEDKSFECVTVSEIPVSEDEIYRISKGCGTKNAFVAIRKFFKKGDSFIPYKRKGLSIQASALEGVIAGLVRSESACAA